MNQVNLVGRIAQDVELQYVGDKQTPVINNSIAVDRPFAKDQVDFFDFSAWGGLAEKVINPYVKKGDQIALSGYLRQNRYQTEDGQNRSRVELIVQDATLLNNNRGNAPATPHVEITQEDLPF